MLAIVNSSVMEQRLAECRVIEPLPRHQTAANVVTACMRGSERCRWFSKLYRESSKLCQFSTHLACHDYSTFRLSWNARSELRPSFRREAGEALVRDVTARGGRVDAHGLISIHISAEEKNKIASSSRTT